MVNKSQFAPSTTFYNNCGRLRIIFFSTHLCFQTMFEPYRTHSWLPWNAVSGMPGQPRTIKRYPCLYQHLLSLGYGPKYGGKYSHVLH